MIAAHPEIFSSFYSVPLPHLDREFLKELRDFLLCGMRAFRRLLLGLHQDSGNVVDLFQQWQQWRAMNGIHFLNASRTAYYAQDFPADFFQFVRLHYIPGSKAPLAMTALLQYEAALLGDAPEAPPTDPAQAAAFDTGNEQISPESRPQFLPGVSVITLSADYPEIVRRLRHKRPLHDLPEQPVKLVIRRIPSALPEVRKLSSLSAELLQLCEEGLTVKEIVAEFLLRNIQLPGIPVEKICLAGIEMLREQHLIDITSTTIARH